MQGEPRTLREAGIGAKVVTTGGDLVVIEEERDGGWFKCRTPEGIFHELHGSCLLMKSTKSESKRIAIQKGKS